MHYNAFHIELNKLPQICNSNTINEILEDVQVYDLLQIPSNKPTS